MADIWEVLDDMTKDVEPEEVPKKEKVFDKVKEDFAFGDLTYFDDPYLHLKYTRQFRDPFCGICTRREFTYQSMRVIVTSAENNFTAVCPTIFFAEDTNTLHINGVSEDFAYNLLRDTVYVVNPTVPSVGFLEFLRMPDVKAYFDNGAFEVALMQLSMRTRVHIDSSIGDDVRIEDGQLIHSLGDGREIRTLLRDRQLTASITRYN